MNDLTDKEREFLIILFKIGKEIIEGTGGYYEFIDGDGISRNDFFNLACKFGIEDEY